MSFREKEQHRYLSLISEGLSEDQAAERCDITQKMFEDAADLDVEFSDNLALARRGKYQTSGFKGKINDIVKRTGEELRTQFREGLIEVGMLDKIMARVHGISQQPDGGENDKSLEFWAKLLLPHMIPKESHVKVDQTIDKTLSARSEDDLKQELQERREERREADRKKNEAQAAIRKRAEIRDVEYEEEPNV